MDASPIPAMIQGVISLLANTTFAGHAIGIRRRSASKPDNKEQVTNKSTSRTYAGHQQACNKGSQQ
eukprot:scaffold216237_cov17-Tisochrysis_lutea.AAC.1